MLGNSGSQCKRIHQPSGFYINFWLTVSTKGPFWACVAMNQTLKSWCFQDTWKLVSLSATTQWVSFEDPHITMCPTHHLLRGYWFHSIQGLTLESRCIISNVEKAGFELMQILFIFRISFWKPHDLPSCPSDPVAEVYQAQTWILREQTLQKRGYSNAHRKMYSCSLSHKPYVN